MKHVLLAAGLGLGLAVDLAMAAVTPALAQGETRLPESTRAEQQVREINRDLSQQIQTQQQNQSFQWQLDNQRMRQQIDIPRSGSGSATCPAGSVGC